ncbi:hypothetical protein D9628_14065, partial [Staphylococcus aureus]
VIIYSLSMSVGVSFINPRTLYFFFFFKYPAPPDSHLYAQLFSPPAPLPFFFLKKQFFFTYQHQKKKKHFLKILFFVYCFKFFLNKIWLIAFLLNNNIGLFLK